MIKYALICDDGHEFEGWFQNSDAFDKLRQHNQLECAVCGSHAVSKAIMAPNIGTKSNKKRELSAAQKAKATQAYATAMASQVRDYVEKNFDDVGNDFPEEARKIHYGESEERGIYGEATASDAKELLDEGIDVVPLPSDPKDKQNVN